MEERTKREELEEVKSLLGKARAKRKMVIENLFLLKKMMEEGEEEKKKLDKEIKDLLVKEAELSGKVVVLPPAGKRRRKITKSRAASFEEFWTELSDEEQTLVFAMLREKEGKTEEG